MRGKHLERRHDLRQGNALVALPAAEFRDAVDEDDEVLVCALVDDLGPGDLAAHIGWCEYLARRESVLIGLLGVEILQIRAS
jgi:hypothetical protein